MAEEATKVAKEEYARAIEKVNENFKNSTVAGYERPDGKVVYQIYPGVQTLKAMMEIGKAKFSYVGQIKLQKTKNGLVPILEQVDMSKVESDRMPEGLAKKAREWGEKRRKGREQNLQKLRSYSSQMPDEIKSMIRGINSESGYAIMVCLSKKGDQTHNQLKEKLGLDDRTLRESIKQMQYGALIDEWAPIFFIKGKESNEIKDITAGPLENSTYGMTMLGHQFLMGLSKAYELPTKKEAREWQLREYQRLGIDPKKIKIQKMKRTRELKPKALKLLEQNPDIKPRELKEKLGANLEDFDRITKRIGYEWKLKDFSI